MCIREKKNISSTCKGYNTPACTYVILILESSSLPYKLREFLNMVLYCVSKVVLKITT